MGQRTTLPCDAASVGIARQLVRRETISLSDPDLLDAAGLLVSELVTNAIVHARTDVTLSVTVRGGVLRVEVADGSSVLPTPRRPRTSAGTGRGLQLVDRLASNWGIEKTQAGKTIWFELMPIARAVG